MKQENISQTETASDSQVDEPSEQQTQSDNQIATPATEIKVKETKVYDEGYVKNLREEAATYRVRAKSAEEKASELEKQLAALQTSARTASLKSHVGLAARDLSIIDADAALLLLDTDALTFNDQTGEYEGVENALKKLVETKPYLLGNAQTPTKPTNPPRKTEQSSPKDLKGALTAYYNK